MSGAQAGRSGSEINKGGVVATTVKRYWQNKAPDWANDEDDVPERDLDHAARVCQLPKLRIQLLSCSRPTLIAQHYARAVPEQCAPLSSRGSGMCSVAALHHG